MMKTTNQRLFAYIFLLAGGLSVGGFILQYVFHALPCEMCWLQRYAHYVILVAGLIGYALECCKKSTRSHARLFALVVIAASLYGLFYAVWQFAAQQNLLPWPQSCTSDAAQLLSGAAELLATINNTAIVPCDRETFKLFGITLATWNIPAMLATLAAATRILLRHK